MRQNLIQKKSILDNINIYFNDDIKKIIYNYYLDLIISFKHNINNHLKLFFSVKQNICLYKNNDFKLNDYYTDNYNSYDSDTSDTYNLYNYDNETD